MFERLRDTLMINTALYGGYLSIQAGMSSLWVV